jgi:hypothetical protein
MSSPMNGNEYRDDTGAAILLTLDDHETSHDHWKSVRRVERCINRPPTIPAAHCGHPKMTAQMKGRMSVNCRHPALSRKKPYRDD